MSSQPRRKLSPDAPARARELAALGLPLASIAAGLGVSRHTLNEWRHQEPAIADAIQEGRQEGETALVRQLHRAAADGDARTACWLLCHAPDWRNSWSDAAAERRAVAASQARTVAVLEAAPELTPELLRVILLRLAAAGEHPDPWAVA